MAGERVTKAEAGERTRRRLLDAAERLFLERGFGTTSLEDIAAEAGVTKGAVYAHYRGKEELVLALLREATVSLADLSMFGTEASLGAQVRAFARGVIDSTRDERLVATQSEYVSLALRNERARGVYAALVHDALVGLGRAIDEALADAPTVALTGTDVVVIMDALLHGLVVRRALNPELVPDRLVEDAFGLVVSSLVLGVVDPDEALERR